MVRRLFQSRRSNPDQAERVFASGASQSSSSGADSTSAVDADAASRRTSLGGDPDGVYEPQQPYSMEPQAPPAPIPDPPHDVIDATELPLVHAWFRQRQQIREPSIEEEEEETDTFAPIDVDTLEVYPTKPPEVEEEDAKTAQTMENDSQAGLISIATSDRTPVVSNRRFVDGEPDIGIGVPLVDTVPEREQNRCYQWINPRTHRGKVILAVIIIVLLLGVIILVVSSVAPQGIDGTVDNPVEEASMVSRVPTVAPVSREETTFAPSVEASLNPEPSVPASTQAPTGPPPTIDATTRIPSSPGAPTTTAPFPSLTTLAPTMPPSFLPTRVPTASPTGSPTIQPSAQPTTQPSAVSSSAPSSAPTAPLPFELIELQALPPIQGQRVGENFGSSVVLSDNGQVLVVAAPNARNNSETLAGRVQVYANVNGIWTPRGSPLLGRKERNQFGSAVAVSGNGAVIAISEPTHDGAGDRAGNVRTFLFNEETGEYEPLGQELAGPVPGGFFGVSVTLSKDGMRLAVGAPYYSGVNGKSLHGQVRVYEFVQGEWSLMGLPLSGSENLDWLGWRVDLSADGSVLVASAPRNSALKGYVQVWQWQQDTWTQLGNTLVNDLSPVLQADFFGESISLAMVDSKYRVAVGIPFKTVKGEARSGMVVVYELDNEEWIMLGDPIIQTKPTSGDECGYTVDLLSDNLLSIGTPGASQDTGTVHLYQYKENGSWRRHPDVWSGAEPGDDFGFAVSVAHNKGKLLMAAGATTATRGGSGYVTLFEQQPQ